MSTVALTVGFMKNQVFRDVTPCSLSCKQHRCGRDLYLHNQDEASPCRSLSAWVSWHQAVPKGQYLPIYTAL